MSATEEPEPTLGRLRRLAWGSTAVLAILGLFWGRSFSLSVLAGAAIAMVNYSAIERLTEGLTRREPRRASWLAVVWLALRYVLLVSVLYVIFAHWRASVVAVILGLSVPVVAVFAELALESYEVLSRGEPGGGSADEPGPSPTELQSKDSETPAPTRFLSRW